MYPKILLILALASSACLYCAGAQAQGDNGTSTLVSFIPQDGGGALVKIRDGAGPSLDPLRSGNFFDPVRWIVVEPITDFVVDNPFDGDPLPRIKIVHGTVELRTTDYFTVEIGLTVPWDTEPQDPLVFLQTVLNNFNVTIDGIAIGADKLPAVAAEDTPEMCASGGLEYPCGFDYYYNVTLRITKPGTYHMVQTASSLDYYWEPGCPLDEACIPPSMFQEEWTLHVTGGGDD